MPSVPLPGQKEISQTSSSSYKFTNFTSTSGLAPPSATITHPGYPYPLPSDHSSSHLGPIVTGSVKTVHSEPSPPSPPPLDNNLGCVPSTVRSGPQIQTSLVPTGRTSIVPIANPTSTVPFDGPILPIFTTSPKETWTTSGSESTRSKHSLTVSTSQSEEHGASIPIEPTHTTSTRSKHSLTVSTSQSEEHSASIPIEPTHSSTSSTSNPQLPTATTAAKPPQTTAPEASGTNTGTVARVHAYAFIVALFAAFF
ncbi:hypothetical protein PRK78_003275 [Emydomyces testavorans]|uniref:Uncharacterized protein n=1 Tax=Emydomyces testavorans TaxID=2070801 RepID=A0AAF0II87_9EURO|nr:hypothetical protein PRK78_003275 [Emydomyces testavorans]